MAPCFGCIGIERSPSQIDTETSSGAACIRSRKCRTRGGKESIEFLKPALEKVRGKTLRVPLFQEQAMQLADRRRPTGPASMIRSICQTAVSSARLARRQNTPSSSPRDRQYPHHGSAPLMLSTRPRGMAARSCQFRRAGFSMRALRA
ncbi:hypothetical protein [Nitrobacter sp. JJSN]|uniref:hypothetical protein n=1 Tax=Nitrobacter sp. JJSN TaxID=3453033 RepID=UPI003F75AB41